MTLLGIIAHAAAAAVLLPALVVGVECLAAVLAGKRRSGGQGRRPRTAVLVPAHDEEGILATAVGSVLADLAPGDRCLVVAHNCADRTAEVGRELGAEVVEARDEGRGGKPDAVTAGLAALEDDRGEAGEVEVVAIVDADCRVEPGSLAALGRAALETGGPVQGVYLFEAPGQGASVSSMALVLKNLIRPQGLSALGLPCLLNGSGSAYPVGLLRDVPHGKGSVAEDYQLSIDLALAGHPTAFVPDARITSTLPPGRRGALRQRKRWEHGHIELVLRASPRLLVEAARRRSPALLALGLELSVPPLSLYLVALAIAALLAWAAAPGAGTLPLAVVAASAAFFGATVLAAWTRFCGARRTFAAIARAPFYVAWKLPLYLAFLTARQKRWTKTSREP